MKYSREYEKQADLIGAQIMARAGYDPRDLAHMFETIQKQGGGGGPEWLSSHPNPGNRTQYINAEAAQLRIAPRPSDQGFQQARVAIRLAAASADDGGDGATRAAPESGTGREGASVGTRRRGGAGAVAPVSDRAGRAAVPGERAVELAARDVEQLDQVRAAERLRRLPRCKPR